jgi:PIN domain nuclease of toxin-antitoxin system
MNYLLDTHAFLWAAFSPRKLSRRAPEDLPDVARRMGCQVLELDSEDAASFHKLPRAGHKDPFDRMLVYQAIRRHKRLISRDAALAVYAPQGLELLW